MRTWLYSIGLVTTLMSSSSFAAQLSLGDPQLDSGEVKLTGAIRTRYLHKNYSNKANQGSANNDWKLADIKLVLSYENPNWIASMDTRCYQYSSLCDAVFLKDAWAGYKFNDEQRLTAGLQYVDFGIDRLWGNSYYETILNTVGVEDIQNLGLKYRFKNDDYHVALGFYARDGGNFKGTSKDSSRYSGNFVAADDATFGTHIKEKNMWIGRASKKVELNKELGLKSEIGGSFWYSDLDNKRTDVDGHRKAWTVFALTELDSWQWLFVTGGQNINNGDDRHPNYSTMGAFDYSYQVANKGKFLVNEISYAVKNPVYKLTSVKPYLSYSQFYKDEAGYKDSTRINAGVYFFYKSIGIQGEYIWSKNDPFTGGSANGLAAGENTRWDQLFYLSLGYYF
ncbi:hypothetical protein B9T31_06950 [Acinetobacter sp. ANC 4558]|uniref:porin n=1 Tax=Acinetobacter sp. ANC 4558 TaxID=1977876 RepID=UPI000A32E25F|nr:porin [Acinetobacter sp. ANC 4558]OTG86727.1 hypothetical protein B9T31_06950 [Acinetobacter sp. ANC 4558]